VYILHQNSHTKGTSLAIVDSPRNDFYRSKLCCLSCTLITSTPPKIPRPGQFWGLQNPYAEIWKFVMGVRSGTSIHVCCFKHGRNRRRISVPKAALYWWQKNKTLCEPLRRLPRIFVRMRSVVPKLHSMFYPNPFRFGEIMMENPFRGPQSKTIGFFEPIMSMTCDRVSSKSVISVTVRLCGLRINT